jgi:glyoxylase-like metal-dependent hydrolase (beta-lactamase superfamily II)
MILKQFLVGGIKNYVYVIADEKTKDAAVIDPTDAEDAIIFLTKNKLRLMYIFNTHSHYDHTACNNQLRKMGGKVVAYKSGDIAVADGSKLKLGSIKIKILYTPGHTQDSICILADDNLFTGDTLFVEECGRTDLPGGSSEQMYESLNKLKRLQGNIKVYPGHLYGGSSSTIAKEIGNNYCLATMSKEEFVKFMRE